MNGALLTFCIYTLAVFGLAALSSRLLKSRSFLSEYFLGSRGLGFWALALTFAIDWALITAVALWAVLHYGVVLREEAYLSAKFGAPYTEYLTRTRRWI